MVTLLPNHRPAGIGNTGAWRKAKQGGFSVKKNE